MAAQKVPIRIDSELFEELQEIAEPLVDDIDSVLEKLIKAWKKQRGHQHSAEEAYWVSARGERLRVGTKLRGTYRGKEFWAVIQKNGIEYEGKLYSSPSQAAIAAKKFVGIKGQATNTNGWRFWEYYEHSAEEWFPIEVLRKGQKQLAAFIREK